MYQLLIVDDESIFREYVKTILDWKDYQIEIAGEAKNGEAALSFLKENEVHIILVDISMPVMDGITFSRRALQMVPELMILLITGHSEFEYAKSALQLGIKDYILKPFDQEELSEAIQKTVQALEDKKRIRRRDEKRDQAVREELANALISDSCLTMTKEISGMLAEAAGGNPVSCFRLAAVEEDFFDRQWIGGGQKYLWKKTVINILDELLENSCLHLSFCGRSGNVVVLLFFPDEESAAEYEGEELKRLCRIVRSKMGFSVTCAMGGPVREYEDIPMAYDQADSLLRRKLRLGYGTLLTEKEAEGKTSTSYFPRIPAERLSLSLKNGNLEESEAILQSVFEEMKSKSANPEMTGFVLMELISICLSHMTERGFGAAQILGKEYIPYPGTKQVLTIDAAQKQVMQIYRKAIGAYTQKLVSKSNNIAVQAKMFIDKNYSDRNLSVEGVARNLYMNASYLRAVFKKEYGQSVSACIFTLRMEKARELIASGGLKLTSVSQMVGFGDAAYFSKCFKKYYGLSPSSFENMQESLQMEKEGQ